MMNLATEFPPATRGTVVVWGLLAAYPFGGMTWQVLHHLAGLRSLGFDVWYVEDSDRYVYDPETFCLTSDYVPNLKYLEHFMHKLQMEDRWVFRPTGSYEVCHGALDIIGLKKLYRAAEAVLNLCGAQELRDEHLDSRCLVFIETDPVANQVAVSQGDKRLISELEKYDFLFTYGQNLGAHDCRVPVERFTWYPTRPPVYTDWWAPPGPLPSGAAFTTIANWMHTGKDIVWNEESWVWRKDVEFKRFINVAAASGQPLELALGSIGEGDQALMRQHGWRIIKSAALADPGRYRDYIMMSVGEFTIAKPQVVLSRSGWFSDRSVCYLAAGRPVVTQDTGLRSILPSGQGLFLFATEEEAVAGLTSIVSEYELHSWAAQEIAREYFATDRVLGDLMRHIGLM